MKKDPASLIHEIAREAESHDREALAEIEAAQCPLSDGGHHITPQEATRIRIRVLKSALLDNEVATLAAKRGATAPRTG